MTQENANWIMKFGTIMVAFLALIQPWLIFLFKKYLRPGSIEFDQSGNIEIGFSSYASTIGVNGTFRSIGKDMYVKKMELILTKKKDSSIHKLDWAVFRDTKLHFDDDLKSNFELPYGFQLSTNSPQRLNIQFHDLVQQDDLRPTTDNLSNEWISHLENEYSYEQRQDGSDTMNKIDQIYQPFKIAPVMVDTYGIILEKFYWEEGKYNLELKIYTANSKKAFNGNWEFTITDEQKRLLKNNTIILQDFICGRNIDKWNFAYSNYEEIASA